MELSTKILIEEAEKLNYIVEIIDENDNFISVTNGIKKEYIKQATKTSLDNYVAVMAMENKYVTKYILENNGIKTPKGIKVEKNYLIDELFNEYNENIVVKPLSTNFGIGITMLEGKFTKDTLKTALDIALLHDSSILIEELLVGKEYRFLIVDNEVIGVLHRTPANILGNGINTIKELVTSKNNHPFRGENYEKPLQKIQLGKTELLNLDKLGYSINSIPMENEIIYLRDNSNISTGGDSIDFTDDIIEYYKDIAINACKSLNVVIAGVDMIISDVNQVSKCGIIEVNFNPAIHIHHYPSHGNPRNIARKILTVLFR